MDIDLRMSINTLRMPKFVWCGEFAETFAKSPFLVQSLLILDATEADQSSTDALLFAGYTDRCVVMIDNVFITLQRKFEGFASFNNLKST